jgi:hypothetical protein
VGAGADVELEVCASGFELEDRRHSADQQTREYQMLVAVRRAPAASRIESCARASRSDVVSAPGRLAPVELVQIEIPVVGVALESTAQLLGPAVHGSSEGR